MLSAVCSKGHLSVKQPMMASENRLSTPALSCASAKRREPTGRACWWQLEPPVRPRRHRTQVRTPVREQADCQALQLC